ncbi:hypothetical protein QE152_g4569 [Popillia japonica]|uniref:Uncharacterized protein n=1 Tax=Popillia japonica TaxID=7064 RepID=A0AAW1N0K2_POPJA
MPKENSYDELINLLEKHLAPEKNILSISDYIGILRADIGDCHFVSDCACRDYIGILRADIGDCHFVSDCACRAPITDIFLRAQFIRGIKDSSIREKLLQSETKSRNQRQLH